MNLAKIFQLNLGLNNIFFFSQKNEYANGIVKENNFSLIITPEDLPIRIEFLQKKLSELKIDLLIIDIPDVNEELVKKVKTPDSFIMILDTSKDQLIPFVNIIVNIYPRLSNLESYNIYIYQGFIYWILNSKLSKKKINYTIEETAKTIFISLGTTDAKNLTKEICQKLGNVLKDYNIFLVIGQGFRDKDYFKGFCHDHPNFKYYESPKDIYDLMIKSDIAISTGGGTMFELLFIGVPTIIIPNSIENYKLGKLIENEKMVLFSDALNGINKEIFKNELFKLINNYDLRKELNKISRTKFSSNGAEKISEIISDFLKANIDKMTTKRKSKRNV